MCQKPALVFDTSVLNALADDGDLASLVAGLRAAYVVCLSGLNISEIVANRDSDRRKQLLGLCRLFLGEGPCLVPHHWIIERMVAQYNSAQSFNWKSVDVRFHEAEIDVARQGIVHDAVAREEREHLRQHDEDLFEHLNEQRNRFQQLFASGSRRPSTYAEFISVVQEPGGAFWAGGAKMCKRITGVLPEEKAMRDFVAVCPPFHAALLGIFVAYYDRCIRDLKMGPSFRAGRYDLFMAVYLPYCAQFVSRDDRQVRALREIVSVGGLSVEVLSYREWREKFDLVA
jgi:hypothetical protein